MDEADALARMRSALIRTTTTGRPAVLVVAAVGADPGRLTREFAVRAGREAATVWVSSAQTVPPRRSGEIGGPPTVLVFEDLHLADAVACTLFGMVLRTVRRGRLLIVATYRCDRLDPDHPWATTLTDLPSTVETVRVAGSEQEQATTLTLREQQVLREIVAGHTNRQIARRLFISEHTVSIHVSRILAKLDVGNRTAAAAAARRLGLRPSA